MQMKYLRFVLMLVCFASCFGGRNFQEAKRVSENFAREYTGIDTLIKIDGHYYREDGTGFGSPFMMSNNGEFQVFRTISENHIQIQEDFKDVKSRLAARGRGNYTLSGDTIKVSWALPYQTRCYEIFSEQYLIVNDTTLRRIWSLCETCGIYGKHDKKRDPVIKDEIYRFYEYQIDTKYK